jgi:hypothetical protein
MLLSRTLRHSGVAGSGCAIQTYRYRRAIRTCMPAADNCHIYVHLQQRRQDAERERRALPDHGLLVLVPENWTNMWLVVREALMARKRHSDEDCRRLLREIEIHLTDGSDVGTACRAVGISDAANYTWRKTFRECTATGDLWQRITE